jgi:hypothetical protein
VDAAADRSLPGDLPRLADPVELELGEAQQQPLHQLPGRGGGVDPFGYGHELGAGVLEPRIASSAPVSDRANRSIFATTIPPVMPCSARRGLR